MNDKTKLNEKPMAKTVLSNLTRAALLALPRGSAIEKAIFGSFDDRAKEKARRQVLDALDELRVDVRFAQADLKDELAMLTEKIRETNVELAEKISSLDPVHIETLIVQDIRPIIINNFINIAPEEIRLLSRSVGMLPSEIPFGDPEKAGEILFDAAVKGGSLPEFIESLTGKDPGLFVQFTREPSVSDLKVLKERLGDASRYLLSWPTKLGSDIWLQRAELDNLEGRLRNREGTANLILGRPGTGKSAILATLAQRLIQRGVPVLAIKSDMLPSSIQDYDDLQRHLNLPLPVLECLAMASKSEPAVLIIDQLDAISEFVDRKSERLDLLLDLVHAARRIEKLHVVCSSRWFEYQHDIRLTTIEAETISLEPPAWEDVRTVLKNEGFPQEHWSEETRTLLSVPLHLKILLELKSRDPDAGVPSSLQGLLESIWQQRVICGESKSDKLTFLDLLCKNMSETEELWLPRAIADNYSNVFDELQQMNILQTDPSGLQIGFVHQTYFDFARSRAFARGQERLSEYVAKRQDGLFIRPVLLSTLDYLRGAWPTAYEKEIRSLWVDQGLRPHLRNLLIDYMGSVENPNDTEVSCLRPMLDHSTQAYKALLAMAGSPGWFAIIKDVHLPILMSQGTELARLIIPFLSRALSFSKADVGKLVRATWLTEKKYDEYVLMLYTYLGDWDESSVEMTCVVAKRHESMWIPHIADLVSQCNPDLAPRIVRADFDRRLQEAIRKENAYVPPPPPAADASDEEKAIYELRSGKAREVEQLLSHDKGWHDLSQIALSAPKAFLNRIWPWFLSVVERIAYDPHPFVTTYQEDHSHSLGTLYDRGGGISDQPVSALHHAIAALSEKEPDQFLTFFKQNINCPYLAVHRLLSAGLSKLTGSHPDVILDYLISDPRRLVVGDFFDCHKESRRLISAVVPHLDEKRRRKLEDIVIHWDRYYSEDTSWSPKERFERKKWNRQHRLRLLRAFPDEHISEELRQLREQEERALRNVPDWDSRIGGGGLVGSPMSQDQMAKAKDEHILTLFEELVDSTEWDHPKRNWDFIGGSIQASREFGKLAEQHPERVLRLLPSFEPSRQERPAAMAVEGLAKSGLASERLFQAIEDLVRKGHSSLEFKRDVASALQVRAEREKGLPDAMIKLLIVWLNEDPYPTLKDLGEKEEGDEIGHSILWGHGSAFILPGGRDVYIEALAKGYLRREPPEYEGFAKVIEARLKVEVHPMIWNLTLHSMSFLFKWDATKAASYFDYVFTKFEAVRESRIGVLEIGRILHLIPDQRTIERWLSLLRDSTKVRANQAFGELLMLRLFRKPEDAWARNQVEVSLVNPEAIGAHRGLGFAASHNWNHLPAQDICTEVLIRLSNTGDHVVQEALSEVFPYGEKVPLNTNMKKIIEALLPHDQILLKGADRLIEGVIDQTSIEPEFVGRICNHVLEAGKMELQDIGSRLAMAADPIVSIALTLHRKPEPYRQIGLDLFERLIESNIPAARQALDVLDRKPVTAHAPRPMRRRRRRARQS
jgi:hypothetical protein